jgi:hypothetical protein
VGRKLRKTFKKTEGFIKNNVVIFEDKRQSRYAGPSQVAQPACAFEKARVLKKPKVFARSAQNTFFLKNLNF